MDDKLSYPVSPKEIVDDGFKKDIDLNEHDMRISGVYSVFEHIFKVDNTSLMFKDVTLSDLNNKEKPLFNISKTEVDMVLKKADDLIIINEVLEAVLIDKNIHISKQKKDNPTKGCYFVDSTTDIKIMDLFSREDKDIFNNYFGIKLDQLEDTQFAAPKDTITGLYESVERYKSTNSKYYSESKKQEAYYLNKYNSLKNLFMIKFGLNNETYDTYVKYMSKSPDKKDASPSNGFGKLVQNLINKMTDRDMAISYVDQNPRVKELYFEIDQDSPVSNYLISYCN